jgi:hypothetical protein
MHRSNQLTFCSLSIPFASVTFAQNSKIVQSEIRLEPTPILAPFHDQFGSVAAASANGNTLAISAPTHDNGSISEAGATYIFDRIDNRWVQTAVLFPNDAVDDEESSILIALSEDGNTLVAGDLIHNGAFNHEGSVYVFHRANGVWIQEAELIAPAPGLNQGFGSWGVGISGDTIVAGDQGGPANGFTPGVDVFRRVNGQWILSSVIQLPDDFDFAPTSVSIRGVTIAAGNTAAGFGVGAEWVFGLVNGSWTLQAKLAPSDLIVGSQFGTIAAIDGNTMIVGAPGRLAPPRSPGRFTSSPRATRVGYKPRSWLPPTESQVTFTV